MQKHEPSKVSVGKLWHRAMLKAKVQKKKRKKKPEVFSEKCTSCGQLMVLPSMVYEHKLSKKVDRLCSECSKAYQTYRPKVVMVQL